MTEPHPRRWFILAILTLSLVLIVASVSSLNLAIPSIQRALNASAAELVWINAAYALVFAGLLLPAGAVGDRFGRRGSLQAGLGTFIVAASLATFSESTTQLIVLRAIMGIGAALTMPATLSIITVPPPPPPHERAKAIAIWSGFAGAGGAIGILASGVLLDHFEWSAVFLVNVPIAAVALVLVTVFVPTSRDEGRRPLDPAGSLLSIAGLSALVYALIEGPERGWSDGAVIAAFVASAVLLGGWVRVELGQRDPLLDPRLFRIPPFSLGSLTVTLSFLVLFGMFFVLTQYLQFVQGYSPLGAAIRTLPFAGAMILIAPRGPALAARIGQGRTMAVGMGLAAAGAVVMALLEPDSLYGVVATAMVVMASGMALVFPTATESIISSLPAHKAGVASAVNDTTREVGGAIGIALLGALLSSGYRSGLGRSTDSLSPQGAEAAQDNVGAALAIAAEIPGEAGVLLATAAGAAVFILGAVIVFGFFPRVPSPAPEPEAAT